MTPGRAPAPGFTLTLNSALPKLAWLARVNHGPAPTAVVWHGTAVECLDGAFVEGIWDGPYEQGRFDESANFFGSGARVVGDGLTFVSSAAMVDCLWYKGDQDTTWVSNSLPLLLSATGDRLSPGYRGYHTFQDSLLAGFRRCEKDLVTERGGVSRVVVGNLEIDRAGARVVDKPLPPNFATYQDYVDYLVAAYGRLRANIGDPARRTALELFSTQSRGYETTAVNAIAAGGGIDQVFTCPDARDKASYLGRERAGQPSDDGSEICQRLGLPCTKIDRLSFLKGFPEETLFFAGYYRGMDVNLREIGQHVSSVAVMITGAAGDMWESIALDKEVFHEKTGSFGTTDLTLHGIGEYRLHAGLIQLPVPMIAGRRRDDIHHITRLGEMDPFRMGGHYDRPVARRIAEERGVEREMFGQQKMNVTIAFPKPAMPFSPELRAAYLDYLAEEKVLPRWKQAFLPLIYRLNEVLHYRSPKRYVAAFYGLYYAQRILRKLTGRTPPFGILWANLSGSIFCFSVNRVAQENYDQVLAALPEPSDTLSG
ncbi:MAG: hypothetical protein AAF495_10370 [Pseudomonadota bacterium]